MFRILLLVGLLFGVSVAAFADHNAGLALTGSVNGWEYRYAKHPLGCFAKIYTVTIAMSATNEGKRAVIIPDRLGTFHEVRFGDLSNGTDEGFSREIQILSQWSDADQAKLISDEPPANRFRILEPGETNVFGVSFKIVAFDSLECNRSREIGNYEIFADADDLGRMLRATTLRFNFGLASNPKNPEALRYLAKRWQKFGVFPLNDKGEFSIDSVTFDSRVDWIVKDKPISSGH